MSNAQLYFAMGVPSVLVILAWITTFMQNNRTDAKLDRVAESIRADMRADRKELTDRFDHATEKIHADLQEFFKTITQMDSRVHRLEERK